MATAFTTHHYFHMSSENREIVEYLIQFKNNNCPVTFQQFVVDMEDYIVEHTTILDAADIIRIWTCRFSNAALEANIKPKRSMKKIDWDSIMVRVLQRLGEQAVSATKNDHSSSDARDNSSNNNDDTSDNNNGSTSTESNHQATSSKIDSPFKSNTGPSSSKRSRSTSAKKDSQELTNEMKEEYTLAFEAMDDDKKWDLGDGVFVEDLIYKYGSSCDFEHLAHSFILDVHDPCWKKIFTPTQLKTIETQGTAPFLNFGTECKEMFSSLSSVVKNFKKSSRTNATSSPSTFIPISIEEEALIIDELWKAVTEYGLIDPKTRYNEHWIQKTMIEIIDLYRYKVIEWIKDDSKMNFIIRIWSMLDRAFDDLFMETRRDTTSVAASSIDNKDRIVTGLGPIAEKMTSIRPDLALFRGGIEYGAGECGKGGDAKKELIEMNLHCPKVLKNMFLFAADKCDNEKDIVRSLRIACFNQFHLHMSVSVMDSPGGYVCRVRSTPQYEVSSQPSLFASGLLKILKLTLKVKYTIQASIKIVEEHLEGDDVSEDESDSEIDVKSNRYAKDPVILPPLMRCSYKKQKLST